MRVIEYGDGRATARLQIEAHHLNSAGTLHGRKSAAIGDVFALSEEGTPGPGGIPR